MKVIHVYLMNSSKITLMSKTNQLTNISVVPSLIIASLVPQQQCALNVRKDSMLIIIYAKLYTLPVKEVKIKYQLEP